MNGKISSGQVLAIEIGLLTASFSGIISPLILNEAKNASLVSILIATVLGIIPIYMITFISKSIKDESLKEFIVKKCGLLGKIINILLIIVAFFMFFLNSWLLLDFIISQFLTRTSYYFIAFLFFIIIAWTVNKGIETLSRSIFILFIFTIVIMLILWLFLIPYSNINNLKPFIDVGINKILNSILYYIMYITTPIIYILDLKSIVNDKNNFERKIVISYIVSSVIVFFFVFFILVVYGIDFANLLTYPIYALFKKIQILGFIERIENFAAIQIVVAFYIQMSYLIYYIKKNLVLYLKGKHESILTYFISLIIPFCSILFFKKHNIINIVNISPFVLSIVLFIVGIIFFISIKKGFRKTKFPL